MNIRKKKNAISILLAAVMVMAGLSGCTGSGTSSETKEENASSGQSAAEALEVHIGDQPSFFVLKIAKSLGYFEEEFQDTGVQIVVDDFVNQGPAIVEALTSGDLDFGVIGALPLVAADANNSHFVALSTVNYSVDGFKLLAGKDTGVESTEDFKGKRVAVKFSTNEHQMLLNLFEQAGLTTSDVEVVNMSTADALAALTSGDVDGAVLKGNDAKTAQDAGAAAIADNSQTGVIANYLVGRESFLKEHPEVAAGVLNVLERTTEWIYKNEEDTVKKYAEITGNDYESAKTEFESRVRAISVDSDKFADTIRQSVEFSKKQNLIDNENLSVENIIDTSYFEQSGGQK